MKTIFEDNGLKAIYYNEKNRILFVAEGYLKLDIAKEMFKAVFKFMKTNKVESFLNDLTSLKGTFTSLNKWLMDNMSELVELGLKKKRHGNHLIFKALYVLVVVPPGLEPGSTV